MKSFEQIRLEGEIYALKNYIDVSISRLCNNNFGGIRVDKAYNKLGKALDDATDLIDGMREALEQLQKLEGANK